MFILHDFVFEMLNEMIGNIPNYKVREYALGWFNKEVLTADDLSLIEAKLEEGVAQ